MKALNLLPHDMRSASRRGRAASAAGPAAGGSGPFVVLGALALCVVAMAAYVLTANNVSERRSELAQVTAEHSAASARAAALKPYGDFQDMAVKRRETVSSLAALRFDWEQALRDVSRALPRSVTLSSLDGSISKDAGTGGSSLRGAIASPAITLKGCTSSQSAVATMLSRLRGVRGVTRVSLAKSEKARTGPGAGAGSATTGPCGEGSPPQFEAVVFFERSTAATEPPATATSTAAAPAAGAAAPAAPVAPGTAQPAAATPTPTTGGTP